MRLIPVLALFVSTALAVAAPDNLTGQAECKPRGGTCTVTSHWVEDPPRPFDPRVRGHYEEEDDCCGGMVCKEDRYDYELHEPRNQCCEIKTTGNGNTYYEVSPE
ncbi:hypothetical protein BJX96DRAFT_172641 [Aspergillus floccosus]